MLDHIIMTKHIIIRTTVYYCSIKLCAINFKHKLICVLLKNNGLISSIKTCVIRYIPIRLHTTAIILFLLSIEKLIATTQFTMTLTLPYWAEQ